MANTVIFTNATGTPAPITIRAPAYPEEPGRSYPFLTGRTMGGGFKTVDLGEDSAAHQNMVLHFRDMSNANYTSMKTFFETTVSYNATAFTYTDPHEVAHANMRYLGGMERARSKRGNRWDIDIRIAKDMSA